MTFVHAAALEVRRGCSHDHCNDRVPVTAGLAPHRHEVVDTEIDATPPAANTASANGTPAAAFGPVTSSFSGSVVSNVNFIASGFGVGEGEAVAMPRA
jgi:biotin carboxyl carrier protein